MTPAVSILLWVSCIQLAILSGLAWAFVLRYRNKSQGAWKDTAIGRHLMRFTAALGVAVTATFVFRVLDIPVLLGLLVQCGVYSLLIIELANRLRILSRSFGEERGEPVTGEGNG